MGGLQAGPEAADPPRLKDLVDRDGRPVVAVFRASLFNPSEGFVQAQAAELRRYQAVVAGLHFRGNILPELQQRLLLSSSLGAALGMKLFGRVEDLSRRLRPLRPRLVHAHFGTDGFLALPLAARLGVPLLTSLRGYEVNRADRELLLSGRVSWMRYVLGRRRLIEQGSYFLAVSDALRERAIEQGFPPDRTITHYNGVDLERFRLSREREDGLVLHVGRLVEKKGTADLIGAFAALASRFPAARLAIIGEGPLEPGLRRQAAATGVEARILFLGRRPADEVAEWMRRAALLAAPSRRARDGDAEGLPNVVVEAAASGLPVVATEHMGIPEAVLDGETGLLVKAGDRPALARAIATLLEAPDLGAGMGAAGRRLAEQRFDRSVQMQRLEALYDRLVASQGRR